MDRFLVHTERSGSAKKAKTSHDVSEGNGASVAEREPVKFISFNCNSFPKRLQGINREHFDGLVRNQQPDIICLQEVNLNAEGPKNCRIGDGQKRKRTQIMPGADATLVQNTMREWGYDALFSLADDRKAGSALLIRKGSGV